MKARAICVGILLLSAITIFVQTATAQSTQPGDLMAAYTALHRFALDGGDALVSNLTLKRDRTEMTFTGTFYFPKPVLGKITGAVFVGEGKFRAEPPPRVFEKENLQRMLNAEVVESDFQTAVLRFTDDTFSIIGQSHEPAGTAPQNAQDLASGIESRTARETGASLASRLLISLVNSENPGVFIAQFDKGSRGRFTFVLDMQCRIPTTHFTINGGEKGLIYTWNRTLSTNDVWLAFHSEQDYRAGTVSYSDAFDQIAIERYDMKVDLREPNKALKVSSKMDMQALVPVRAISFAISEDLPEDESLRKKKGMRVTGVRFPDGTPLQTVQEEWESGFTVLLPALRKTHG